MLHSHSHNLRKIVDNTTEAKGIKTKPKERKKTHTHKGSKMWGTIKDGEVECQTKEINKTRPDYPLATVGLTKSLTLL